MKPLQIDVKRLESYIRNHQPIVSLCNFIKSEFSFTIARHPFHESGVGLLQDNVGILDSLLAIVHQLALNGLGMYSCHKEKQSH